MQPARPIAADEAPVAPNENGSPRQAAANIARRSGCARLAAITGPDQCRPYAYVARLNAAPDAQIISRLIRSRAASAVAASATAPVTQSSTPDASLNMAAAAQPIAAKSADGWCARCVSSQTRRSVHRLTRWSWSDAVPENQISYWTSEKSSIDEIDVRITDRCDVCGSKAARNR